MAFPDLRCCLPYEKVMKQTANNTQITCYQYTVLCLVTAICCEALNKILLKYSMLIALFLLDFINVVCLSFVSLRFSNTCIICGLLRDFEFFFIFCSSNGNKDIEKHIRLHRSKNMHVYKFKD